ncbi:CutC family protein [Trichomonas vaginalis G3]|uniref:Copper homeostasis protein cutC homolog n=1 Tax=Trichomonas vaginalis (strain ATCC PRA-98 / G3) TaxID=412133 RepID=A2F3H3_TRIV3|nr:copper ion homeostasis [Trichomonas vaginalis G3]EAY00553.1 CutC family protein [Trichomonas vaginalis G3]KAI5553620.1 copper ion homeostasis [Trichomonas vaginalis G3]|eukprot:XP_001313482.1 CutC family protein [Trichomonas vaginalis G3]
MKVEVCVDNIESVKIAESAGASRIELCGSLALGGVTPPYSLIKKAVEVSKIPIYVMIRPRAGDFLFNEEEVEMMINDIKISKELGAKGVVIGALTKSAELDIETTKKLVDAASGIGVTFHRAFDLVKNPKETLKKLIELGCERVLTSGCAQTAFDGREMIKELVELSEGKISIMAGAGVSAKNCQEIVKFTNISEIHLSGKTTRESIMDYSCVKAVMGQNPADDGRIGMTSYEIVYNVCSLLNVNN